MFEYWILIFPGLLGILTNIYVYHDFKNTFNQTVVKLPVINFENALFYVEAYVGGSLFEFLVNTGSALTWVYSKHGDSTDMPIYCRREECLKQKFFTLPKVPLDDKPKILNYISGTIHYVDINENVTFGGDLKLRLTIGGVVYKSVRIPIGKCDNGGMLTLGGFDYENCERVEHWIRSLPEMPFWYFVSDTLTVGNISHNDVCILTDTGSSVISLPEDMKKYIYNYLKVETDEEVDCFNDMEITITKDGFTYSFNISRFYQYSFNTDTILNGQFWKHQTKL
ncbi:unnamed protein product [Bursaphelenchus okinawaensis]|uniref:Peptidase A1 domain-containing protein n=1 Tax=Bursaphelenchus okinawaensis TaxID=465554 RepID=A0A811KNB3_9BILA|nr:unnamed protein product [Bursaphelenchus okinawaensis]CAG9106629.1 unnamed protein product [Bursaphelenchus okinawaensis]